MSASVIGIDLGGTNLRVCLVNDSGNRIAEDLCPLPQHADGEVLLSFVVARAAAVRGSVMPIGVGVGVAGALDNDGCLIGGMTNLPALAGVPLAESLQRALGVPCRVCNDARAAMLGEARFGAARTVRNALTLTLGTGTGGGLLLDGAVRVGPHRLAGEIGLTLLHRADAPGWIALEDAASPGGLRRTRGLAMAGIVERAEAGDQTAAAELGRICEPLAVAIINCHVALDLEKVLLTGGMTRAGEPLVRSIRAAFARLCPPAFVDSLAIELAGLGEWAGAMGAAALWFEERPRGSA